ncbi:hypothetical protein [Longimicrobium sp.]|jgi:hypothetical protein|uniref:hypothetical protein n=1 Tax=Longimicrobium sp. TaxID=2029185 RepID=UPI002F922B33
MILRKKLALAAVALVVGACSAHPTDAEPAASVTKIQQSTSTLPDTSSAEATSTSSSDGDGRTGNLFGSGT